MKLKIRLLAVLWPIVYLTTCSVAQAQVSAGGAAEPVALGISQVDVAYIPHQAGAHIPSQAGARVSRVPKPLAIGDTIPEFLWQLPLQVVNHPEGKDTITLGDYRGKLILLDFLATWCASCIAALPKLNGLQQEFHTDVAIVMNMQASRSETETFWQRNQIVKQIQLPCIVSDTMLIHYFPHRIVSHLVWIDPQGRLASTSRTDYAEPDNINLLLAGQKPHWLPKVDVVGYDSHEPVLGLLHPPSSSVHARNDAPFYSALSGYLPGVDPSRVITVDSVTHQSRFTIRNATLYSLILQSHGLSDQLHPRSMVCWQVQHRDRYRMWAASTYRDEWSRRNRYCYEASLPIPADIHGYRRVLANDLQRFFPGLHTEYGVQRVACLKLVRTDTLVRFESATDKHMLLVSQSDSVKVWQNCPMGTLVNVLNRHVDRPVVDATAYIGSITVSLPVADLADIPAVTEALRAYGLDLVPHEQDLPILTIIDQSNTFAAF